MQIVQNTQAWLQGYKTYFLLALLLLSEISALAGWTDIALRDGVRTIVLPLTGITFVAKVNRSL